MWKRIAGTVAVLFCLTVCAEATFRELPVMDWEQRSDWLNVRDYGAKGDGKTDDTQALQKAFDKLGNGVTIYLPPGRYLISDTLKWRSEKRLTGTTVIGHGETTQLIWNGPMGGRMVRDSGLSLARYVGIVFDGKGKAAIGMWNDQECKFETQVRYSYLAFRNLRACGILCENNRNDLRSDSEPTFENCIFDNTGTGVEFTSHNDYDFAFKGCLFINNRSSGIFCRRGNFYMLDSRFEKNSVDIIAEAPEHGCSIRRCVSFHSGAFLRGNGGVSPLTLENCTVSSWSSQAGAIQWQGSLLAFNNTFLTGHKGKVIFQRESPFFALSNNSYPADATLFQYPVPAGRQGAWQIPAGRLPPLKLSESRNFLAAACRLPKKVFDAKRDFGAKGDGKNDDTESVRRTIAAAQAHGKDAIAYFPAGTYLLKQSIHVEGADYFIGGSGVHSILVWDGSREEHAITVRNPQRIVLEHIRICNRETLENHGAPWNGEKGANILQEGGSQPSSILYNGVFVYGKYQPSGFAKRQGILFRNLKEHDRINLHYLEGNQRYENAENGIVLGGICHEGSITIDNAAGKGFLGIMVRLATHADRPLQVRKNASFVLPDFYLEQGFDILLSLNGDPRLPAGRISLGLPKFARAMNESEQKSGVIAHKLISFDNYRGSLNLLGVQFHKAAQKTSRTIVLNKGKESKLNLVCPYYYDVILETQTDLSLNQIAPNGFPKKFQGEKNTSEISCALDDFTRLGLLDLEMNYTATR